MSPPGICMNPFTNSIICLSNPPWNKLWRQLHWEHTRLIHGAWAFALAAAAAGLRADRASGVSWSTVGGSQLGICRFLKDELKDP